MNRRRFIRVPVQVWVEQWTDRETYHQQSSNLSLGGVYLDRTVPHPEGTLVNLRFTLRGDDQPIECKGRIVYPRGVEDDFGMGLEFVDLPAAERERIARHLREELARLPEDERRALEIGAPWDPLLADAPRGRRGTKPVETRKARGGAKPGAGATGKQGTRGGRGGAKPGAGVKGKQGTRGGRGGAKPGAGAKGKQGTRGGRGSRGPRDPGAGMP